MTKLTATLRSVEGEPEKLCCVGEYDGLKSWYADSFAEAFDSARAEIGPGPYCVLVEPPLDRDIEDYRLGHPGHFFEVWR